MIYRLIAPGWLNKAVLEGEFTDEQIQAYNSKGYNIYYLPNHPTAYKPGTSITGADITDFHWVFCDFDFKDGVYQDKESVLAILTLEGILPTKVIDSGHGVHVYWKIMNLDAKSYLRFQRRLVRLFNSDKATCQLYQLMRKEGTLNTKVKDAYVPCIQLQANSIQYTAEEFDKLLPPITMEDEAFCQQHYDKTYGLSQQLSISDKLPAKFGILVKRNSEALTLFTATSDDRSKADFRLACIMLAAKFTKEEALSVLINCTKALERAPIHRQSYAVNIVDKVWTHDTGVIADDLFNNVNDITSKYKDTPKGKRISCWRYVDDTVNGFRLGQVLGLVGGSGVGKTTLALNIFMGFVRSNPELEHFFCPLEQTDREIADRWRTMCGSDTHLHEKVHIFNNYDEKGAFRDLSLDDIKQSILNFQEKTGKKAGCVVIDHIGVLCNNNKLGQDEGVKGIAKAMKGFAEETQTFLIMQSQTSRAKAGIGDLELDKDAAFGTSVFENFCDFLVTLWQPLKRVYDIGAPTILSYKFCKIRNKKQDRDVIKEDKRYSVFFDPKTELIRELQEDDGDIQFWVGQATSKRKLDKQTDILEYTSIRWTEESDAARTDNNRRH